MFLFIVRRLLIAIPILILSSVLVFVLVVNAGDPLENLRSRPNSQQLIEQKTSAYHLDQPVTTRYFTWAKGVLHGDFGKDANGQEIRPQLTRALWITMRLVIAAALIAVVLGITVGVISAIRQYTLFDYGSTFLAFLFFAMPVFWFAVLLKEFGAIKLNNWLQHPGLSVLAGVLIVAVFAGLASILFNIGEKRSRKRGLIAAGGGAVVGLLFVAVLATWFGGHTFTRWVSTIGPESPNFNGSFFASLGDKAGHMILPTITLAVISFATYSRFQRASMLDTHVVRLRPHGAGQGPVQQTGHLPPCLPHRADPRRHPHGHRFRPPARRRDHHRDGLPVEGDGHALLQRRAPGHRPQHGHGLPDGHGHARDRLQHPRRHRLRLPRSEDPN